MAALVIEMWRNFIWCKLEDEKEGDGSSELEASFSLSATFEELIFFSCLCA